MKIGFSEKQAERDTLQGFLRHYRDTPHLSTGITPSSMLFRDGARSNFPRTQASDADVLAAKQNDWDTKNTRKEKYNTSRHTKPSDFHVGEQVLVRNFYKQSKFEPSFLPERYTVMDVLANGKIILVHSTRTGTSLRRHPNDLKRFEGYIPDASATKTFSEHDILHAWREAFADIENSYEIGRDDEEVQDHEVPADVAGPAHAAGHETLIQPEGARRVRRPNPRYFNDDFVAS